MADTLVFYDLFPQGETEFTTAEAVCIQEDLLRCALPPSADGYAVFDGFVIVLRRIYATLDLKETAASPVEMRALRDNPILRYAPTRLEKKSERAWPSFKSERSSTSLTGAICWP